MNITNILKLAQFLEDHVSDDSFGMAYYRANDYGENIAESIELPDFEEDISTFETDKATHNCGTVGCALGWSPFCEGMPMIPSDFDTNDLLPITYWNTYCERVFGFKASEGVWDFLFSGSWEVYDDSRIGAINRLRYLVHTNGDITHLSDYDANYDDYDVGCGGEDHDMDLYSNFPGAIS